MKKIAKTAFVGLLISLSFVVGTKVQTTTMPCRYEDEVLVGTGNFTAQHGWDGVACIAADDIR